MAFRLTCMQLENELSHNRRVKRLGDFCSNALPRKKRIRMNQIMRVQLNLALAARYGKDKLLRYVMTSQNTSCTQLSTHAVSARAPIFEISYISTAHQPTSAVWHA